MTVPTTPCTPNPLAEVSGMSDNALLRRLYAHLYPTTIEWQYDVARTCGTPFCSTLGHFISTAKTVKHRGKHITECVRGHVRTPDNTIYDTTGHPVRCKQCSAESAKRWRESIKTI